MKTKNGVQSLKVNVKGHTDCDLFRPSVAKKLLRFLDGVESYHKTPLQSLDALAKEMGVAKVYVKDESQRLGLKSFKAAGVIYGVAMELAKRLDLPQEDLDFSVFFTEEMKKRVQEIVLIAVTDGNHGKALAYTAKCLGCDCYIYMPRQKSMERVHAIEALGAKVEVCDLNYDHTLKKVIAIAKEKGYCHIQDQAWEGYTDVPNHIAQGYTTIAEEIQEVLGDEVPTHIFLQAGAGSFPLGIAGYYASFSPKPHMTIVEPDTAACFFKTAKEGKHAIVEGELDTIMAGLSVGEPNIVAEKVFADIVEEYLTCENEITALGMRILGAPLPGDPRIIAGESGAVGLGVSYEICTNPDLAALKKEIGLDENSRILCINTEGDTDPILYKDIVWKGKFAI